MQFSSQGIPLKSDCNRIGPILTQAEKLLASSPKFLYFKLRLRDFKVSDYLLENKRDEVCPSFFIQFDLQGKFQARNHKAKVALRRCSLTTGKPFLSL